MYHLCRKPEEKVLGLTFKRVPTGSQFILSISSKEKCYHFTDDRTIWKGWKTLSGAKRFKDKYQNQESIRFAYIADSELLKI